MQHRPALLLALPVSEEAGSNADPVCPVPLYPLTVCSVSGVKSTLSGVPLTKQSSLLVSHGFIYMFFSLIRKENIKKLKFPLAVFLVVMILEAILVSLCVPLNYPCICAAFSGLGV